MRFAVVAVSTGAALTLVLASGLMNLAFMTSLGASGFERQILGAVSIAVSLLLALLPTLLVWAYRERRTFSLILGVPVFFAFGAFSLSSAIGFAAKNRGSVSEERALATARLAGLKWEIEAAGTALKALGPVQPVGVLKETMRGLQQDRRWQSSQGCQDATAEASRAFCKSYFERKAEVASALEAGRLQDRIIEQKREGRQLEEQGAGREADSQAAVLARFFDVPAAAAERSLTLFLAVLVEIGAALGLFFAMGPLRGQGRLPLAKSVTVVGGRAARARATIKFVRVPPKQIAAVPRRVPRLGRS